MKHRLTLIIDGGAFFDAVQKVGQETAGARLLETVLQASTGQLGIRDHLGLSIYGIEAEVENAASEAEGQEKEGSVTPA